MRMGEVDLIRDRALPYCIGHGLDLGCGYNKITPDAWGMDLSTPYVKLGDDVIELIDDASKLAHIRRNSLDYIFSSHLLEDFDDTRGVMYDWLSCLKSGGYLILYLPNQQRYEEHCKAAGAEPNPTHKIKDMSLGYIKSLIELSNWPPDWQLQITEEIESHMDYSFFIVIRKTVAWH